MSKYKALLKSIIKLRWTACIVVLFVYQMICLGISIFKLKYKRSWSPILRFFILNLNSQCWRETMRDYTNEWAKSVTVNF